MIYPYIVKGSSQSNERYPEQNYIDFARHRINIVMSESALSETILKYEIPMKGKRVESIE